MIQIRCADAKGTILPLPQNAAFIELCDDKGNIAAVISYDPITQAVNVFDGDSEKAKRYKDFFKVNFIKQKYNVTDVYNQDNNR